MNLNIRKHIPNTITSFNLLSGSISIVLAFEGYLMYAVYFIFLAAIFDFFDGMTARLLKAYTLVGKEMDSLADMVSFGVAPSVIVFHMMKISLFESTSLPELNELGVLKLFLLTTPFLIAVLSGVRLAKFNIDERQSENFIGLPTPANALFFVSLYLISQFSSNSSILDLLKNEYFLAVLVFLFSLLMVAEFPMFSLKLKSLSIKENKIRYIFIVLSVILLILLQTVAVPLIITVYILLSSINNWFFNLD